MKPEHQQQQLSSDLKVSATLNEMNLGLESAGQCADGKLLTL